MCVYFRAKYQVSSIILTSFRQGEVVILPPPLPPPQNEPLKSLSRVKGKSVVFWDKFSNDFFFFLNFVLLIEAVMINSLKQSIICAKFLLLL